MPDLPQGRVFIIAEMANAHEGDPLTARAIIEAAAGTGADAIKFQVFTAAELAVPSFSNYGLYEQLQMSEEAWAKLLDHAYSLDLRVFADVFGLESAELMQRLGVDGFKIHAADVLNVDLLQYIGRLGRPVFLSLGGSTWIETAEAVTVLKAAGANSIVLMHGFQGYPTRLSDSHLRRIELLRAKFGPPIGFASHVDGDSQEAIMLPIWAVAAGADVIEVHITLDRSKQGLDYYSSLDPVQFSKMVRLLRAMEPSLGERSLHLSADEVKYRLGHKKWLVTTRDLDVGEMLSAENVALRRVDNPPSGRPLSPNLALGHQGMKPILAHSSVQLKDVRMKVAATLACRAESSRLYGKPMQLVGDRPIIQHLIDRLQQVKLINEIVLAISEGPGRGIFIDYAERQKLPYIVGSEKDVLGRLILAADYAQADIIVRTTTENPFIYWENIDDLIQQHIEHNADLTVTEKLPLGAFVEIISLDALKKSHNYGEDRHRSELCTLFIAENLDIFTIQRVAPPAKLRRPEIRLTVDTPHDLIVVRTLWQALQRDAHLITIEEIIDFINAHPDVAINTGQQTLYLWK